MHEMSIAEGILQVLEDAARREGFARVERVRLTLGAFAGVEVPALEFGWEVVSRGSLAEGSVLEVEHLPGQAWCFDCATTVAIDDRLDPCPACGGGRLSPVGGDEMRIRDLEVV